MEQDRRLATQEKPLLNMLAEAGQPYISEANRTDEDDKALIWNCTVKTDRTHISQQRFDYIYRDVMTYLSEQEKYMFKDFQTNARPREEFFKVVADYLIRYFPSEMRNENDFNAMMKRLDLAVYGFDVLQPLIDNPDTSDIKICGPFDIRVRVKGKAYKSNTTFFSNNDLKRFIDGIGYRNYVDISSEPVTTFTDDHDRNYILRFVVSNPIVNAPDYPYMHIRKVPKDKPDFDELIRRGLLTEDIKTYLIDRAKNSRAIVIAGPPGSGKSTILNALIEYIPKTLETLIIQENDELTTQQSGFMFKHVTHGLEKDAQGKRIPPVTLEELGRFALVEGCNVFIIGEVKGGEMRAAMTLLNAGGRFMTTVHSISAMDTLDKLADLVKYGSTYSLNEARRMLKSIDTVVYAEGYKVREIVEIKGYDDDTKQYNFDYIYKYPGK